MTDILILVLIPPFGDCRILKEWLRQLVICFIIRVCAAPSTGIAAEAQDLWYKSPLTDPFDTPYGSEGWHMTFWLGRRRLSVGGTAVSCFFLTSYTMLHLSLVGILEL